MERKVFCSHKISDSEIEFVYDDGTRVVKLVENVLANDRRREERELREYRKTQEEMLSSMGYADWSEFREDTRSQISITYQPVDMGYGDDRDITVEDEEELESIHELDDERLASDNDLLAIAHAYDSLNTEGSDSKLAELVNDYVTLHGLCLPLWEVYQHSLGYRLGYRVGVTEALIIPEDNEDEPLWVENLYELRRLFVIVERGEVIEASGVTSESTRWLYRAHVNNGKIKSKDDTQLQNWRRAIDHNYKNPSRVDIGNATLPVLVQEEFSTELMSVACFVDQPIGWSAAEDTREKRWQALTDLVANHYQPVDANENVRVSCVDGAAFDYQLVRYWLANTDLPIPSKRWIGERAAAHEWQYSDDYDPVHMRWRDVEGE